MRKAEVRKWTKKTAPCYVEKHHVFIQSIYGKNSRTVFLSGREHYVAHLLLWKIHLKRYGSRDRRTSKVGKALHSMSMKSRFTEGRYSFTSHQFEITRKANIESMKGSNHWTNVKGVVNPLLALNKDPARAKRIGQLNGDREREKAAKGRHQWQDHEMIEKLVKQRRESGVLSCNGKKTKGKLWWNNGHKQARSAESPGPDWVRGRLPFDFSSLIRYSKSEEGRLKNKERSLGKKLSSDTKDKISLALSEYWRKN